MSLFLLESSKTPPAKTPKKVKVEMYKLSQEQKALIKNDKLNKKLWDEAMESLSLGPVRISVHLFKLPQSFNSVLLSLLFFCKHLLNLLFGKVLVWMGECALMLKVEKCFIKTIHFTNIIGLCDSWLLGGTS